MGGQRGSGRTDRAGRQEEVQTGLDLRTVRKHEANRKKKEEARQQTQSRLLERIFATVTKND